MQQTKLKVSNSLLCATIYFIVLFGRYTAAILLAGYALLFEESRWLRENAVQAISLLVLYSVVLTVIGFIPVGLGILAKIAALSNGNLPTGRLSQFTSLCTNSVLLVKDIMFLLLGFKALRHDSISVIMVENLILTHTKLWE